MNLGNFKVGANVMVQAKNAPPPDMTMLVTFSSKVVSIEMTRVGKGPGDDVEGAAVIFENGAMVIFTEADVSAGRLSTMLS